MKKLLSIFTMLTALYGLQACNNGTTGRVNVPAKGVLGQVKDTDGKAISGVTVKGRGVSASTDSKGQFVLNLDPADGAQAVLSFAKDGYVTVYRRVKLVASNASRMDVTMSMVQAQQDLDDASAGGTLNGAGITVKVDANVLVDASGQPVTGKVSFQLTHLDPAKASDLSAYPGTLTGKTESGKTTALQTYGVVDVTAMQNGKKLQVADGKALTVNIPPPAGATNPPAKVALWSLDEQTGLWTQEGYAEYDQANKVYVAKIPHMSPWNLDQPLETTCIKGKVIDENGNAVGGGQVLFQGSDIYTSGDTISDDNGAFCMSTPRNQKITITAIHPSGGGTQKAVTTPDTIVPYPPQCDQCKDIGTITVKSGYFTDSSGNTKSCDQFMEKLNGTCAEGMKDYGDCFKTSGKCVMKNQGVKSTTTWENGARMEMTTTTQSGTFESVIKTYGPDGQLCGTTHAHGSYGNNDQDIEYEITDMNGKTWKMDYQKDSGDLTILCPDGGTVQVSKDELDAYNACMGQTKENQCKVDNGGNMGYTLCSSNEDCDSGMECCRDDSSSSGVCIPKGACPY